MSESFVKMMRGPVFDELVEANPFAFTLAAVIARRARWSSGFNKHGLEPGEAFLGDFRRCGMTEQQYRTAKALLTKWGLVTFKPTNKGTVAKLMDTRVFSVLNETANGQGDEHSNGRVTTNYKGIEGKDRKEGIEGNTPRPPVAAEPEPVIPTIEEVTALFAKWPGDMARGIPATIPKSFCEWYHDNNSVERRWTVSGGRVIDWQKEIPLWWRDRRNNWKPDTTPQQPTPPGTLTAAERISAEKEVQRIDTREDEINRYMGDFPSKEERAELLALKERKCKLLAALSLKLP